MKKILFAAILAVSVSASTLASIKPVVDCKMTIRDNASGKSYTITVHGQSCASLLKQLI